MIDLSSYISFEFLLFVGISCLAYFIAPKKVKWVVLLAASMYYYFCNSKMLTAMVVITTLSIYLGALQIGKANELFKAKKSALERAERKQLKEKLNKRKKYIVVLIVVFNFGLLWCTKYFNFFGGIINDVTGIFGGAHPVPVLDKLVLPLGISYYTLMAVSYVVDVYRGKTTPDKNFFKLLLFVTFFPQMVEGPIGRYNDLAPQLCAPHPFKLKNLTNGVQLIMWGLVKKMIIADRCGVFVQPIFADYEKYAGLPIMVAIGLYTIQIYADFSGCIDIVTGVAQILGISLAENFKRPFFSRSINEFWRRWHITLGAWLRDYIFYPVSMSRWFNKLNKSVKKHIAGHLSKFLPAAVALFFVWFTNGFWHGADWKYILYGLYYYAIMMIGQLFEPLTNKFITALKINTEAKLYKGWQIFRTIFFVCIGMLIFNAKDLVTAFNMFCSMIINFKISDLWSGILIADKFGRSDFLIVIMFTLLLLIVGIIQERGTRIRPTIAKQCIAVRWVIFFAAIFAIILFGTYGIGYDASSFIYGNF